MIWFACKQCGKTHSRPETSAGSTIFCTCGQGLLVPWESTAPPAAPEYPLPTANRSAPTGVPVLEPISFDPQPSTPRPGGGSPPSRSPSRRPPLPEEDEDERPGRRRRTEKRDPEMCFNHQRRPRVASCADCKESFCDSCLVDFQDVRLCGPCKNFRARRLEIPAPTSPLAMSSVFLSMICAGSLICLLPWRTFGAFVPLVLTLFPMTLAMVLALWALRRGLRDPRVGATSMAITGVAVAGVVGLLALVEVLSALRGWV